MGWTSTPLGKNIKTADYLKWIVKTDNTQTLLKIGKGKRNGGNVPYYLAVQDNETGFVRCIVALTKRRNGSIWYTLLSEKEGPLYYDCPKSVFNLLTPITEPDPKWFAYEWREKVKEYWQQIENYRAYIDTITKEAING